MFAERGKDGEQSLDEEEQILYSLFRYFSKCLIKIDKRCVSTMNPSTDLKQLQDHHIRLSQLMSPLYLLIPLVFWAFFNYQGVGVTVKPVLLGAAGWIIALALRGPVSLLAARMPAEKGRLLLVSSSGPLEELVRLVTLLIAGLTIGSAASIGIGWAAIEIVYTLVSLFAVASLSKRTDEKAMQAKAMLEAQGTYGAHPAWGLIERVFVSAYHIGAALCIARYPWSVAVLIPLHSLLNLAVLAVAKRSLAQAEAVAAFVGTTVLAIGWQLYL
ncbi:hypothetical protein PC41400_24665 [Paenibacillus chitinolyticus]|uniref:YhfC family intramembrane metalloprotease n=2 Tax=Paenibacillus chitinolyticus TaxID=79263 RepID=A0A410X585_9BACL|nr:hypothetical protein PC41400_24665 [Paenibacillus chitinolyticus]